MTSTNVTIDLRGLLAVVTGGSRGIGAATAEIFARAGADIAVVYRSDRPSAQVVADKVRSLGRKCAIFPNRVERLEDCRKVARQIVKVFSRIDILVNNAGIWEGGPVERLSSREWQKTIEINLTGTFNWCRAVIPSMKRRRFGKIINISSTAGQRGEAFHSHYGASKGGVIAFTKSIAPELIPFGIHVNCVAPGWVRTDMTASVLRKTAQRTEILRTIPRGRIATPEEIAGPILFLASSLAENIVGEVLNVNGGSVLCG